MKFDELNDFKHEQSGLDVLIQIFPLSDQMN